MQRHVGGHKDKELQLFTFLHNEEQEQSSPVRKGANCKRVMWSDESRFQQHHVDERVRILRKQNESMNICNATTFQAGGGDVIVWGMFSWH
ncbi:hypothetical protein TNCV_3915181 [Trichonephila clavipes]|nr:hypothetical protein TNCV_3915181 [Trichonephila clavipes]